MEYVAVGVVVELDGRLGHEAPTDRWKDLERDLDAVVQGDVTVRAGWGLVLDPSALAAAMVRILLARGWTGLPHGARAGMSRHAGSRRSSGTRCRKIYVKSTPRPQSPAIPSP